jgi:hypothetical protein
MGGAKSVATVYILGCSNDHMSVSHSHLYYVSFIFFSHPLRLQQHLAHSRISINHISLLSSNRHHYFRLNHFRIYFMDNEFEKTY